jgi:hypothetical protein
MTIYQGSRYEYATVDFFSTVAEGNENAVVFYNSYFSPTFSYTEHTYIAGERLDSISQIHYGRPDLWWFIMDYNPEISDPQNIRPGTVLRIPNA